MKNTPTESAESEEKNHNDSVVFDKPSEEVEQPQTAPAVTPEVDEQPSKWNRLRKKSRKKMCL